MYVYLKCAVHSVCVYVSIYVCVCKYVKSLPVLQHWPKRGKLRENIKAYLDW
jgi:hypothetical protein